MYAIGALSLIPSGANPTPVQFGKLRDISLSIDGEEKELLGQYQVGVEAFRPRTKFNGKAKFAWLSGSILAAALPGATTTTGSAAASVYESWTIPTTPFQVTVAQSATFLENLGVRDLTAGKDMVRVASAPTAGQYSVAAGVYTFASADAGHNVVITYKYNQATTGKTISFSNQLAGPGVSYVVEAYSAPNGTKTAGFKMYGARIPKLAIGMKAEDWIENDFEFFAIQDASSTKVIDFYVGE